MFNSIIEIVHLISYQLCMTWLKWLLKLHFGLWIIPHLILTHNTQDFVQIMLISFVWLYMFKCDVYAHILADQTQKDFWVFYMFLKVILYFHIFSFVQNAFLCFSSKTGLEVFSREARDLELPVKCAWGKLKSHIFIQKLSLLPCEYFATKHFSRNVFRQKPKNFQFRTKSRYCFATKSFSRKLFSFSGHLRDWLATSLLLPNSRKIRVFSFIM